MRKKLALLMRHCMLPKLSAVTVTNHEQQRHYPRSQLHERIRELAAAEGIIFNLDEGNKTNGQDQKQDQRA